MTRPPVMPATADSAGVRVPPPLFYALGIALGLLLQALIPITSWPRAVGVILGALCLALGVALCAWAIGLFGRARTSLVPNVPASALVEAGPYRFTRNPMYLGLALAYIGTALWLGLSWSLLLLPFVLTLIYGLVITKEERYLERTFGEAYKRYRSRVRRWL